MARARARVAVRHAHPHGRRPLRAASLVCRWQEVARREREEQQRLEQNMQSSQAALDPYAVAEAQRQVRAQLPPTQIYRPPPRPPPTR